MPTVSHLASGPHRGEPLRPWRWALFVGILLGIVPGIAGCGGCFGEDPLEARRRREEEEKKKAEQPKDDFAFGRVQSLPRDETMTRCFAKPGHWVTAWQPVKANNFDFHGELISATTPGTGTPLTIPGTSFRLRTVRPAPLPKGQAKLFESPFFIPPRPPGNDDAGPVGGPWSASSGIWMQNRFQPRRGGRDFSPEGEPVTALEDYQHFLVVLASDPDRYGYLSRLASVSPPYGADTQSLRGDIVHYRVLLPRNEGRVPLPSHPLAWTSIAYIVWDGMNPNRLSLTQQEALLDWLHWGGQIILSGPNSLAALQNSFLGPYLPVAGGDAIEFLPEDLVPLNENWSLASRIDQSKPLLVVTPERPLLGVQVTPHPQAVALPDTGGLVQERRVGRGRVVATAFGLADRALVNWPAYDSFFNACLLRRPRRRFQEGAHWAGPQTVWADLPASISLKDARITTNLRYFTRDVGFTRQPTARGTAAISSSNVASWNDAGASAAAARETLSEAAGIRVPNSTFVFRTLAVYLAILVPANWLVFRLLGRVEWAWLAAPLIAVAGAGIVIRMAQLDIGFARSRTEIGILELQGGYPRGHVTRYTALYAALSTSFGLDFDDNSALALPFPERLPYAPTSSVRNVEFRRGRTQRLSGVLVKSSSAGYVHSEQFFTLDGPLDVVSRGENGWTLRNASSLNLRDSGIFQGTEDGQILRSWLGDVPAGTEAAVQFQPAGNGSPFFPQWSRAPLLSSSSRLCDHLFAELDADGDRVLSADEWGEDQPVGSFSAIAGSSSGITKSALEQAIGAGRAGSLSLGRHLDLACDHWPLRPGDMRLIGWIEQVLPGVSVSPSPAQNVARTLVVVHLRYGQLPTARPDANLLRDVAADMEAFGPQEAPLP